MNQKGTAVRSGSSVSINIAVLGCGTVGSEVVRLLQSSAADLRSRVGAPLELVGVAVKDPAEPLPLEDLDPGLLTDDPIALARRADVVVELMGGIEPARSAILAAFESGASVVTANKALLGSHGPELYAAAER
ncbi:MAG: homoserine dehydrogenase, partial [Bifidobacteriaceae bacterium]|nr:homoserine dehydrogenase [Bifidobacteriaceae bacterium]